MKKLYSILLFTMVFVFLLFNCYQNYLLEKQVIKSEVFSKLDNKVAGEAYLRSVAGKLVVNLSLNNHPNTIYEGSFLQSGSCQKLGEVKYYLALVYDGKSSSTLDLEFKKFVNELPLAIAVYEGQDSTGKLLYCGDINKIK